MLEDVDEVLTEEVEEVLTEDVVLDVVLDAFEVELELLLGEEEPLHVNGAGPERS